MAAKIFAEVMVLTGSVMVRAFGEAYRKALVNGRASGGTANAAKDAAKSARMIAGLTRVEAQSILGVTGEECTRDAVVARADLMFAANDKANGGSIYIQSKVLNAKDCILLDVSARPLLLCLLCGYDTAAAADVFFSQIKDDTPPPKKEAAAKDT